MIGLLTRSIGFLTRGVACFGGGLSDVSVLVGGGVLSRCATDKDSEYH